jgi:hypothetical protein
VCATLMGSCLHLLQVGMIVLRPPVHVAQECDVVHCALLLLLQMSSSCLALSAARFLRAAARRFGVSYVS